MKKINMLFEQFSSAITHYSGSTGAFLTALSGVAIWATTGSFFNYSENWQLVINTTTTIITFLMVFLIQKSQNKESISMQIKLNELIASNERASNRIVGIEDLSEEEMKVLKQFYTKLSALAKSDGDLMSSHSIDEAVDNHQEKSATKKQ